MRLIGSQEIRDIALGAAIYGTGGGGDPHIGMLMALQAVERHGPVKLISIDEVPEDELVVPASMMGAPTVLVEKIPSGEEASKAFSQLEQHLGRKIFATMPVEAGGVNSMLPFVLAASSGMPVVDSDGMGRAFPELQMVTFTLAGISTTPMVLCDEKGNSILFECISNMWAERLARTCTVQMGGSVMMASESMTGKQLRGCGIHGIVSQTERVGRELRLAREQHRDPIQAVLEASRGKALFCGKVTDVERKTTGGFVRGVSRFSGLEEDKGRNANLAFQNEFLMAYRDGELMCSTPDLIAVLDRETGLPITTEALRYGARVMIIGIPCDPQWRTPEGLALVGPAYFGYDEAYIPLEQRVARGN